MSDSNTVTPDSKLTTSCDPIIASLKPDEVRTALDTLPPESREIITRYFDNLKLAADDIHTLVDVSRLALESLNILGGESIEKALMTATDNTHDLYLNFVAMAAEGAGNE